MAEETFELDTEARKLTSWKNEPSIRDLKQDFEEARTHHDEQKSRISGWLDNLHVQGKARVNTPEGSSRIVPQLIRKQAEWRYPALSEPFLSTDNVFKVSPVTWEDTKAARQNQLVLNHQFNNKIDKVAFIDEYVRTAVDEGTVILRVGWNYEEEEEEVEVPEVEFTINPAFAPTIEQLAQFRETEPDRFAKEVPSELQQALDLSMEYGSPVEPTVTGTRMETQIKVVKNHPTVEVCDYRNVVLDPTCQGNIDKAGFVIYSFESSLAELKKDKRYKNLDKINIEAHSILGDPDHAAANEGTQTFNFSDKPRKKFVVYEYWGFWDIDGSGRVRPIVASWVGSTLIRMEENPFPDQKLPFITVPYLPVRKSAYGEPDGALLEDNQRIIGAVTRGMIDILGKSANGQTGIRKDALDVTNRRKFEKGLDYEFNANVDPRQAIFMHTYPEIPASAQFMLQLQNMEAESLTGVKAFNQGVTGQSLGDVAAGIRGALDAASKRELAILRRLAQGIVKVGRKFISMNAVFLSDTEVVRITEEEFVEIRRDDLAGEFDLQVAITTAEDDNAKAQELAFMLQTMGNNMDASMSRMILADIARLRKMPELAKRIEEYEPQPDPIQQKMQELELAKMEAEVMELQAKAMKLQAEAQLSGAKIDTEDAKASHLRSDKDLKDLNFVEQESGVKQERDLQKQGEQARAQAQLKLLDHAFKKGQDK